MTTAARPEDSGAATPAVGIPLDRRVRRWRAPTAKPGELVMRWGKLPREAPDMCFAAGEGSSKRDMALLHYMLASKRMRWKAGTTTFDPSELSGRTGGARLRLDHAAIQRAQEGSA